MIALALTTLRHRKAGFAGAFVALLCAAALVTACGMLLETGLRGTLAPERYAGAPVIVAGDQFERRAETDDDGESKVKAKALAELRWIPEKLAGALAAQPGVEKVVTEVTFPVGDALGHGWESAALTPFTLKSGRAPQKAGEVVVDARFSGGTLTAGGRTYRVVGVTEQALPSQNTVFFSTAEARRLAGRPGQVSAIGVFPQVPVKAEGAVVYTGAERGPVEFRDGDNARIRLTSIGGAMGGTSLLVAILVVVGTFALSVQQRQRELALLRAIAATPRQLRRMIGGEALVVSAIAGTLGAAAGMLLGGWLIGRFVALGAVPGNLQLVLSPFPPAAGLLATLLAAWAAARVSARRTSRIRPVEALGEAAAEKAGLPVVRLVAGFAALAGSVVLTVLLSTLTSESASSPVTMLTALAWSVAVALLAPLIVRAVVALPVRLPGTAGFLASRNVRAGTKRMASLVAPLSLMIAMTCTILFVQTTLGAAAQEQVGDGVRADFLLSPGASAEAVRQVPGVRAATEVLRTSIRIDLDRVGAQAVSAEGLERTLDLGVVAGSMAGFGATSVAVSTKAAEWYGVGVGDRLALSLGDGTPAELTVAAVYTRGMGFSELTLPYALVSKHVDDPRAGLLVAGGSRAALEKAAPGIAVLDQAQAAESGQVNAAVNYVAMGLIIGFCAIAVVNTLAMATSARTRELALLRLVGTTRRQVLGMLRQETALAVALAAVLGTFGAAVTLMAFSLGMTGSVLPSVPPLSYAGVIAAVALLALAATVIPARMALREAPAEAIGGRE
ncbi:FtsX-like permease family protein [Nonomuraea typhae]|uniref:FtsX-like permease family protein n=1 Tax=Nonomuraea typhae TaxID=2603600 RepID=A0ABW7Z0Y4_9ACTN